VERLELRMKYISPLVRVDDYVPDGYSDEENVSETYDDESNQDDPA